MDAATTTAGLSDLKFRLVRESFADAVSWVAKNLPSRPAVPVLSGVLLSGTDDGLTISGFDYEVSAEAQVAAEIASPGSVLVSGRLLSDIVRALPNKPIDFYVDGNRVALNCGNARFSLPTMAVEDYPTLPALPDETGTLPADLFAEAISQVAIAAGRDDTLPMLTGIRVEISGDTVVLAATDRFRLAVRELTWSAASPDIEAAVLVPPRRWPKPPGPAPTALRFGCRWARVPASERTGCSVSAGTASAAPRACSMRNSRSSASCCRPSTPPSRRSMWRS